MKKAQKIALGCFAAVVLIFFAEWFWSLGAVASVDVAQVRVEKMYAKVEIKKAGQQQWEDVVATAAVNEGDTVRTDAVGKAEIRWGDRGVTRLDSDTELVIDKLPIDLPVLTKASVGLRLNSGRVWSRVMKLLDLESSFEVRTNEVAATVRGTSFGVIDDAASADIAVTDSAVSVLPASGEGQLSLVREGRVARYSASGTLEGMRELTEQDAWPNENRVLDEKYDRELREELIQRAKKLHTAAPDWLVALSENLHLGLAQGEERRVLASSYLKRDLAETGIDLTRYSSLDEFRQRNRRTLPLVLMGKERDALLLDISATLFVLRGYEYRFSFLEKAFIDLRSSLFAPQDNGEAYARALEYDDRIDDIVRGIEHEGRKVQDEKATVTGELEQWQTKLALKQAYEKPDENLWLKVSALHERIREDGSGEDAFEDEAATTTTEDFLDSLVEPAEQRPTGDGTDSTDQQTGTATQPNNAPAAGTTCTYHTLTLAVTPSSGIKIGDKVTLTLLAACANGKVDDVTMRSTFYPADQKSGRISGNLFYPSLSGGMVLIGSFTENGVRRTAEANILVAQATRTLEAVRVTALGPTSLTTGQSVPVEAVAIYSDDRSQDVTQQCRWSTSDPKLAAVIERKMTALSGTGKVDAVCAYSEGGNNVTGSLTFTISLDPALQPSNGTAPYSPNNYTINMTTIPPLR
ncbi:MAG: FecR family protein [Patescibacteria group bacterium]|nr:FecR family protein [Patescibacteria group bacterium]